MKQQYKTDLLDLRCMDCIELMRETPDNYFDLAIVDPPYFADYGKEIYPGAAVSTTGVARNRYESKQWNVPNQQYFEELRRVSKNQVIWGINYYPIQFMGSGRIVWDKINDSSSFSKCELAYCSLHDSVQIFRYRWNGMLHSDMKKKEHRIHPTQKPVKLYQYLLRNYAKPGDTILDTHLGSASIAIACHYAGHHLTGCELDPDYFEAAVERVKRETAQMHFL